MKAGICSRTWISRKHKSEFDRQSGGSFATFIDILFSLEGTPRDWFIRNKNRMYGAMKQSWERITGPSYHHHYYHQPANAHCRTNTCPTALSESIPCPWIFLCHPFIVRSTFPYFKSRLSVTIMLHLSSSGCHFYALHVRPNYNYLLLILDRMSSSPVCSLIKALVSYP